MSQTPEQIEKYPQREPAEEFYRLRREGIGFIEQMASRLWTDYNTHDPGITTLEALCYAITDLAYRIGWDIKDILAPAPAKPLPDPLQPFPDQAFFTARQILTVNPATPDDFGRLLIDLKQVRNAWVFCKECACELSYYAWCENQELRLAFQKSKDAPLDAQPEVLKGLYDVRLELEADSELGDLNDRKIEHTVIIYDANGIHPILMELRFPETSLTIHKKWTRFLDIDTLLEKVTLSRLSATKTFNVYTNLNDDARDPYILKNWRNIFYLDFGITYKLPGEHPVSETFCLNNATLRIFSDIAAKTASTAQSFNQSLKSWLEDISSVGVIHRYRKKARLAQEAVANAKATLLSHRNLDEDFCTVNVVVIEEIAVCADVEVKPDADIELVQAQIWFEIEQYFNPPVRFHTLQELLDTGEAVEEIFNGPELKSGFIKPDDLEAASNKSVLRVSDIINRLMEIDGIISVNQLLLTRYDAEGNVAGCVADPDLTNGIPSSNTRASWLLLVSNQHQPRLYLNASRFLFYKNGLLFRPQMDEALDTLNQLRGEAERPKSNDPDYDLRISGGTFRESEEYFPVQYSFPSVYGIGPEGVPSHASEQRKGQAKQLKAYLMVFEQILANALTQLAHTADLFSLNPGVNRTYFVKAFSNQLIQGFDEITNDLYTDDTLGKITETEPEFLERRNRFLDHLLARFGEQFNEYALLLSNVDGKKVALKRLIDDKISYINEYPLVSHDRAKAFDYSRPVPFDYSEPEPEKQNNESGIKRRISLLLGYPDLKFDWVLVTDQGNKKFKIVFQLIDKNKKKWMPGSLITTASSEPEAKRIGYRTIIKLMNLSESYEVIEDTLNPGKYNLKLKDHVSAATTATEEYPVFDTKTDATAIRDELIAWSANERLIIVEHLLLRPKFTGDALYQTRSKGSCKTCGDEDPYSFRLTFVMPGWSKMYKENMDMRRFTERTIRQETPSHLFGKICWIGNDGLNESPCEAICKLAELLIKNPLPSGSMPDVDSAVECAKAIYKEFDLCFKGWYEENALDYIHPYIKPEDLNEIIKNNAFEAFASVPGDYPAFNMNVCWDEVKDSMVKHFQRVALHGWQFELFEKAWFRWLDANAKIDWTEERLYERVKAILGANLNTPPANESTLSQCAAEILTGYGVSFYSWMERNQKAGKALKIKSNDRIDLFTDYDLMVPPDYKDIINSNGLQSNESVVNGVKELLQELLEEHYNTYKEVSYWLWIILLLLSRQQNSYPVAMLHDCEEGSNQNPARLDTMVVGN